MSLTIFCYISFFHIFLSFFFFLMSSNSKICFSLSLSPSFTCLLWVNIYIIISKFLNGKSGEINLRIKSGITGSTGIKSLISVKTVVSSIPTALSLDNGDTVTNLYDITNTFNNYFASVAETTKMSIKYTHKHFSDYFSNESDSTIFL